MQKYVFSQQVNPFDIAYKFFPVDTFNIKHIQNNDLIRVIDGLLNN